MKVVVSGGIGTGKSTAVRAAMKRLGWREPAGFFTHWGGTERGGPELFLETWSGDIQPVARRSAHAAPGALPYELDLPAFERAARAGLLPAESGRPAVIDELGLIEGGAAEFREALARLFRGAAPVLAVVQERALDVWRPFIESGEPVHWLTLDAGNRDALPGHIAGLFRD